MAPAPVALALIVAWQPPDTVKRVRPDGSLEHLGREDIRVAGSPAAFRALPLRELFATHAHVPVEETIALAAMGRRVVHVPGDPWSHHIVDARDLAMFEALLAGLGRGTLGRGAAE